MPDLVYVLLTLVVFVLLVLLAGALDRYLSADLSPDHALPPSGEPTADRPEDRVAR